MEPPLAANRSVPPSRAAASAAAAATTTRERRRRAREEEEGSAAASEVDGAAAVESIAAATVRVSGGVRAGSGRQRGVELERRRGSESEASSTVARAPPGRWGGVPFPTQPAGGSGHRHVGPGGALASLLVRSFRAWLAGARPRLTEEQGRREGDGDRAAWHIGMVE